MGTNWSAEAALAAGGAADDVSQLMAHSAPHDVRPRRPSEYALAASMKSNTSRPENQNQSPYHFTYHFPIPLQINQKKVIYQYDTVKLSTLSQGDTVGGLSPVAKSGE